MIKDKKKVNENGARAFIAFALYVVALIVLTTEDFNAGPAHHESFSHAAFGWKLTFFLMAGPLAIVVLAGLSWLLFWLFTGRDLFS